MSSMRPSAPCAKIKLRRSLQPFYRKATNLPAKSALMVELLVRADDSPLRLNGSGLLLLNAPWKIDTALASALKVLREVLDEGGGSARLEWLRPAS